MMFIGHILKTILESGRILGSFCRGILKCNSSNKYGDKMKEDKRIFICIIARTWQAKLSLLGLGGNLERNFPDL